MKRVGKRILPTFLLCLLLFGAMKADATAGEYGISLYRFDLANRVWAKEIIAQYDANQSEMLESDEIAKITSIDFRGWELTELSELEYFTSLKYLDVRYNDLTELDVSKLPNLVSLKCSANSLTELDVSNNPKLKTLYVTYNNISSLDLSHNPELTDLNVGYNELACLNLGKNSKLATVGSSAGNIHVLNGTRTEEGQYSYDLSKIPGGFDVSKASNWSAGTINGTKLIVDAGVREVKYTYEMGQGFKAVFTLVCFQPIRLNKTNFPDEELRTYLTENFDLNGNGYLSFTETSDLKKIALGNCSSGKGLELLFALQELKIDCYQGSELDLSRNRRMNKIEIYGNPKDKDTFAKLTLGNANQLRRLTCDKAGLKELDVSKCVQLRYLSLGYTQINTIDLSKLSQLKNAYLGFGTLQKLDVSSNTKLTYLDVESNQLTELKLNPQIENLFASKNELTKLDLSACSALEVLDVEENPMSEINVTGLEKLRSLDADDMPNLTKVGLAKNAELEKLSIESSQIAKLDLSDCVNLEWLYCNRCKNLTDLDLSACTQLERLEAPGCNLQSLVLPASEHLESINVSSNQLKELDLSGYTKLAYLNAESNYLMALDISDCAKFEYFHMGQVAPVMLAKKKASGGYYLAYSNFYGKFDPTKVVSWENGTPAPKTIAVDFPEGKNVQEIRYIYDIGAGKTQEFHVKAVKEDCFVKNYLAEVEAKRETYHISAEGGLKVYDGDKVTLSVGVDLPEENCTFKWYKSTDGEKWTACASEGYNTGKLKLSAKKSYDGLQFRCEVKYTSPDDSRTAQCSSVPVKLTVIDAVDIYLQTKNISAVYGESVNLSVYARSYFYDKLTYQWKKSTDGGKTWVNASSVGAKTSAMTLTAKTAFDGYRFRCLVSDSRGYQKYSEPIVLSVAAVSFAEQPDDIYEYAGEQITFSVKVNAENPTYRWMKSIDNGKTWVNSSSEGAKTDTLKMTAKKAYNGYQFKCIVTDKNGIKLESRTATLQLLDAENQNPVYVIKSPANVTAAAGESATFTVTAGGEGLKYQWKKSTDGGVTWVNSSSTGSKTDTLSMVTKASYNGFLFRCIVTDKNGVSVTSDTAALTVK